MPTCVGCKHANWRKTAIGRKHPDGSGKCGWLEANPIAPPVLPYIHSWRDPIVTHGYIWDNGYRGTKCPMFTAIK